MRANNYCILWVLLFFSVTNLWAQNKKEVKGVVIDELTMTPMIGVNVSEAGTVNGVYTDADGKFSIELSNDSTSLIFSFIGYQDYLLNITDVKRDVRIILVPDTEVIEETIVVGYGRQKKASSVGSIGTAKGEDLLKSGSVTTVSEALQGQIAGVVAINTTSKPGDDAASIFIRGKSTWGSASPLILVDGIQRDFNDVDVNEIESISILKDASATAVYGVKGANGVILLTTKRGKKTATRVNFSANFGFKQPTSKLEWSDYLTSMEMYNEAVANDMQWDKIIPDSKIEAWRNAYATGNYGPYNDYFPEIDWWDTMVKDFGFQQNYNLNIRGGSERMSYFASVGYLKDGDIYNIEKQEDFDPRFYYNRYNWRTNFDFLLTKTTKLSVNIAGKMGYRNQPAYRDADSGDSFIFNPFFQVESNRFPIKYSDGVWGADEMGENNLFTQMNYQGQRTYKSFQGFYDLALNQDLSMLTKGLSFKATVSFTSTSARKSSIVKAKIYNTGEADASKNSTVLYYREYDYSSPVINADGSISYPMIYEERFPSWQASDDLPNGVSHDSFASYSRRLYYDVSLFYDRSFHDHNITALALFNRQIVSSASGGKMNFPSYEENWVGRVTYNWKERYLLEANAAYTGSEKFAPGKRFGFFPSVSIGWRVTEEPFMKNIKGKWLSNMKLRYSYGEVGSDKGAPRFNYIQLFDSGGNVTFGKNTNITYGPLYTEGALAYENATWETAIKQNIGIELTFFKDLRITLDLYDEKRDGILMKRQTLAPWMGNTLPSVNIGKTKSHGIDLEMSYNDNIGKDFLYYLKFNFATSENRVVFKDDPSKQEEYLKAAGKPIGYSSKYIVSGNLASIDDIFNYSTSNIKNAPHNKLVPGDLAYIDYNADGTIDSRDIVPVEQLNYPLTTYSLSLGFNYKGFGLSAMFYAVTGLYKDQIGYLLWDFPKSNVKTQLNTLDRWTVADRGETGVIRPAVHITNDYNSQSSTYTYSNHSFLRLKNLEINYTIPKKWLKTLKMQNCQIYVNGNNLFTVTAKGYDRRRDPETGSDSVYPIVKRYNVGLRLTF